MATTFTTENFEQEVLNSSQPVLVDFWAPWCPPCRKLGPTIDQLADEQSHRAKVGKLNIDDFPQTAAEYGITSIPSVLIFKDGVVVDTLVGVNNKADYTQALEHASDQTAGA